MKPITENGCSRFVLLIGNYAFKFPITKYSWRSFLRGLLHNMQESMHSKRGLPCLCPVIFAMPGGFMNVMLRCKPLTESEYDESNIRACVKDASGLEVEHKSSSYGWLDGRIVAFDYGD